jgi:hypothetical protein
MLQFRLWAGNPIAREAFVLARKPEAADARCADTIGPEAAQVGTTGTASREQIAACFKKESPCPL